jgi:hypothetical protein
MTHKTKKKKTKAQHFVGHHYNANNVDKTCALLQTNGVKDELNIVFMLKS